MSLSLLSLLPLLLVLQPGCGHVSSRHHPEGRGITYFLKSPFEEFVNKFTIKDFNNETFQLMENAKECFPIEKHFVQLLLEQVELYFFYGGSASQFRAVPLRRADSLLNDARWDRTKPMAVYTFGWLNTPQNVYTKQIIRAYHANGGFNLVVVDWHKSGSLLPYGMAVTMVPQVGQRAAEALSAMVARGARLGHVVGHSLGAQISGHIGRHLSPRPPFLVGLDPAGPLFYPSMFGCQQPISASDGQHVTVLHTDWGRLGSDEPTGRVDMLPHGGHRLQPGCNALNIDTSPELDYTLECSHNRAIMLWCNAVSMPKSIVGRKCYSFEEFEEKNCDEHPTVDLASPTSEDGTYFFKTRKSAPYGLGYKGL